MASIEPKLDFDLVIIGSGMAGASLALALAESELKIALIDSQDFKQSNATFDDRAIALAYGSKQILASMGIWGDLTPFAEAIKQIHISEQGRFGFSHLAAEQEQVEALGYVVTAKSLGQVLLAALETQDNITCFNSTTLLDFSINQNYLTASIKGKTEEVQHLHCQLLVAADGLNSSVRQQLQLATKQQEYGQSAITANIETDLSHQNIAYERFCTEGPLALLPMTKQRCGLVWTHKTENIDKILDYSDQDFIQHLQKAFGFRLGRITKVGERSSYPLSFMLAKKSIHQRIALIGNAAHSLHPIAGQGFNLGLRDVAVLAEILNKSAQQKQDIGCQDNLEAYQQWRNKDQKLVSLMTNSLVHIFTNPLFGMPFARNLGLLAVDFFPPVKHLISRQAMGLRGTLPDLARKML